MRPKWDTPLNRALNELKGLPLGQRPQYGRVHGAGDDATWKVLLLLQKEREPFRNVQSTRYGAKCKVVKE